MAHGANSAQARVAVSGCPFACQTRAAPRNGTAAIRYLSASQPPDNVPVLMAIKTVAHPNTSESVKAGGYAFRHRHLPHSLDDEVDRLPTRTAPMVQAAIKKTKERRVDRGTG